MHALEELLKELYGEEDIIIPSRAEILQNEELQPLEGERCRRWLPYCMFRWTYTKDAMQAQKGKKACRKLEPLPHTCHFTKALCTERKLLVPKSRKMQATWTVTAAFAHFGLSTPGTLTFVQSQREEDASDIVKRCEYVFSHYPRWVRGDVTAVYTGGMKSGKLIFSNGSEIRSVPGSGMSEAVRMHTANKIYIDEGAHLLDLHNSLTAALPCLEGGGQIIITSSIAESYFYDLVDDR